MQKLDDARRHVFANCLRECGIECANRINKAAIHDMSAVEIRGASGKRWAGIRRGRLTNSGAFFDAAMELATAKF
jgi:hypothetical protein